MPNTILTRVRTTRPLVHCITNYVTANDCANLLLAAGASPIMADSPRESAQVTAQCDGLLLNIGTPNDDKLRAMLASARAAAAKGIPIVLDPVGVGISNYRRNFVQQLLDTAHITLIRGNRSEIRTLALDTPAHKGVDSADHAPDAAPAILLARQTGAIVVMSGSTDMVTDGTTTYRIRNGAPIMGSITGAGCQLSALLTAFLAAAPDRPLDAAVAAVCAMGICGEHAAARMTDTDGNAACRSHLIDALYRLTGEQLQKEADYD